MALVVPVLASDLDLVADWILRRMDVPVDVASAADRLSRMTNASTIDDVALVASATALQELRADTSPDDRIGGTE